MILTNCAACAAPLAHTAPRCVRCHTRYCNQTCQHDHWRRGHKQMCMSILAARGLPPDWTEEELERQGYDLWATRPEDVYTGPPPVPDPWRGDGRGVAAAMRAQLESAFSESG